MQTARTPLPSQPGQLDARAIELCDDAVGLSRFELGLPGYEKVNPSGRAGGPLTDRPTADIVRSADVRRAFVGGGRLRGDLMEFRSIATPLKMSNSGFPDRPRGAQFGTQSRFPSVLSLTYAWCGSLAQQVLASFMQHDFRVAAPTLIRPRRGRLERCQALDTAEPLRNSGPLVIRPKALLAERR